MKAIKTFHPIAAALYEEYCRAVGGFAFNGDPLPSWQRFRDDPSKLKQSDAWIAVADKAAQMVNAIKSSPGYCGDGGSGD